MANLFIDQVPRVRGNSNPHISANGQLIDVNPPDSRSPRPPLQSDLELETSQLNLLRAILYRLENPITPTPTLLPNIKTLFGKIQRPADTNAYAANDSFSDSVTSPVQGGYALAVPTAKGRVRDGTVVMSAGTLLQGELWIFDVPVTNTADNAAFDVKDDVIREHLVGVIPFNCTDVTASNSMSYVNGLDFDYEALTGYLYVISKVINAPTPASAEIQSFRIHIEV